MDDMNAFERQVAGEVVQAVGPLRPVDDLAMFNHVITTTQSPTWRFQSMFSATKFVVAGAIVALFGGFLLSGVLMQPSDEQLPVVGASASAQAEPTAAVTTEPETTTEVEPDSTNTTPDLLPGVDLVTEEVEPGVYRVLSDGERDLRKNVWDVAVGPDGEVWVESFKWTYVPRKRNADKWDARTENAHVFRLGRPETYDPRTRRDEKDDPLSLTASQPDGTIVAGTGPMYSFDGERWVTGTGPSGFVGSDGSRWWHPPFPGINQTLPSGADGRSEGSIEYTYADVGFEPGTEHSVLLAQSGDQTIWATAGAPGTADFQIVMLDGDEWERIPSMEPSMGESKKPWAVAGGPGRTLWVSRRDGSRIQAWRWDGEGWTAYGPIETAAWRLVNWAPSDVPGIHFNADGSIWLDGLVKFDGQVLQSFQLPASSTNRRPMVGGLAHAPDGSVWISVLDSEPGKTPGCPKSVRERGECIATTDGLYVITPEAVAASE